MIENWKKGNVQITFASDLGQITNSRGTIKNMTREDLILNGWKQIDNDNEEWEDVDMSEPEVVAEQNVIEIE